MIGTVFDQVSVTWSFVLNNTVPFACVPQLEDLDKAKFELYELLQCLLHVGEHIVKRNR